MSDTYEEFSGQALANLCEREYRVETQRQVPQNIGTMSPQEQQDWFERLLIPSGLRGLAEASLKEANKMGISLDVCTNKFYQEAFAEGLAAEWRKASSTCSGNSLDFVWVNCPRRFTSGFSRLLRCKLSSIVFYFAAQE